MLNIAIAGAGGMAAYHYKGFVAAGATVVAVCDVNIKNAERFATQYGIKRVMTFEEALADTSIDAISIITPNKFHHPMTVAALDAGKNVYCEKPPALNAHEMLDMLSAARKNDKLLMFDFNNRARPESQAIKSYIDAGEVGRINSAQAFWIRRAGIPGFGGWFTQKNLSGGGPLIDLPHMLDLALYFMGYPEPAQLLGVTYNDFINDSAFKGPWGLADVAGVVNDVEAAAHAMITFRTGQSLMMRCSWAELNERELVSVTFQGTKAGGKVERLFGIDGIDSTSQDSCMLFTQQHGRQVNLNVTVQPDESMGRIENAANFARVLMNGEEPYNKPEQALILMRIIDALYKSASTGKAVEF
ncbi:MAG: Gfo/Idh/MocA family oxidoreductase [Deferribacteraceae bacterium]|jgi:predicted dehydrogenase|nr:Gfo/Idh/MocA family oxidoreductase [Deferribacteraceae bacterium]